MKRGIIISFILIVIVYGCNNYCFTKDRAYLEELFKFKFPSDSTSYKCCVRLGVDVSAYLKFNIQPEELDTFIKKSPFDSVNFTEIQYFPLYSYDEFNWFDPDKVFNNVNSLKASGFKRWNTEYRLMSSSILIDKTNKSIYTIYMAIVSGPLMPGTDLNSPP